MKHNPGAAKKAGQLAAKEWYRTARKVDKLRLAGMDFEYGTTLDDLTDMKLPSSDDRDFSWGFYKQVKSKLLHQLD